MNLFLNASETGIVRSKKNVSMRDKSRRIWLQEFLSKYEAGEEEDQFVLLKSIISQIEIGDPNFKSVIRSQISAWNEMDKQNKISKELIRRLKIQNRKLMEQVEKLRIREKQSKVEKNEMREHLNDLLKLNQSLAGALGTCAVCWGTDPKCENCSGNGSSGWVKPNRKLFNLYVLPVLRQPYVNGDR